MESLDTKSAKKGTIKKGRRAGLPFSFSLGSSKDDSKNGSKLNKNLGWAEDSEKSTFKKGLYSFIDQEPVNKTTPEDDIPSIPTLDDYSENDLDQEIIVAPLVTREVASFKDLEKDILQNTAFANMEDINLRVLTSYLRSNSTLNEPDEPWTKESLLSEIRAQQRTD